MGRTNTAAQAAECVITWKARERWLVLDFANLPLSKLVNLDRLEHHPVDFCTSWEAAGRSLREKLRDYLSELGVTRIHGHVYFKILVELSPEADREKVQNAIAKLLSDQAQVKVAHD